MNINYQSDFKIVEMRADGKSLSAVPFDFSYYVKKEKSITASYDGKTYKGCEPTENGGIVIPFDHAMLGIGEITARREYHLPDGIYGDGKCDIVSVEKTGIILGRGVTDCVVAVLVVCPPFDVPDVPDDPSASVIDSVLHVASAVEVEGDVMLLGYGSVTNNILTL